MQLFIDANLPVERKLNPSVTKAWRKAYAYFSTPSPNDSFSHRLKTRVSLPPPPVDDNAPPPERVEDKVERLEAEVRGSLTHESASELESGKRHVTFIRR